MATLCETVLDCGLGHLLPCQNDKAVGREDVDQVEPLSLPPSNVQLSALALPVHLLEALDHTQIKKLCSTGAVWEVESHFTFLREDVSRE